MSSLLILFCWLQKDAIIWNDSICQRGNNIIAASTMNMLFRLKSKVGGRGRALLAALDNASKNHADKSLQFPNGGGAGSPNGGGAGSPKACSEYTMLFILFSVSWVCWCHCVWNWAGSLNWPLSLCAMSPCLVTDGDASRSPGHNHYSRQGAYGHESTPTNSSTSVAEATPTSGCMSPGKSYSLSQSQMLCYGYGSYKIL